MRNFILSDLKGYIKEGFQGELEEQKYYFRGELAYTILKTDGPYEDFCSYSTYGLSRYILNSSNGPLPFGIEILSGAPPLAKDYPRVLITAYKHFVENETFQSPGTVLLNAVKMSGTKFDELPHLYFSMPAYWNNHFDCITINNVDIRFLVTFPISAMEYKYLKKNGRDKFEDLLINKEVDIFNPKRNSSIKFSWLP